MSKQIKFFYKTNKVLVFGMALLMILLFKNPLSSDNIISELEPSPDSVHYLNPLISLTQGKGLVMSYQQYSNSTNVPPLYTLVLFPIYFIFREIRFFYITNVILTIISVFLFYKITVKLFINKAIIGILFLSFVTNYVVFWYPSVPMAENLLMPVFLLSIWLILQPFTLKTIILRAFVTIAFFATKYIAGIISFTFIVTTLIGICFLKKSVIRKGLLILIFLCFIFIFFIPYAYAEFIYKNINIFEIILNSVKHTWGIFLSYFSTTGIGTRAELINNHENFSIIYFKDNFNRYFAGLVGGSVTVAGIDFIIIPIIVGMIAVWAIFINLFTNKNHLLNLFFLISLIGILYFVSTFYIVDARYLFVFIPILLITFGFFLDFLEKFFLCLRKVIYFKLFLVFSFLFITINIFPSVLKQIKINFIESEKALNYQTIQVMNNYTSRLSGTRKPYIISVLSPYMIDIYSNHKYQLLPLSKRQNFINNEKNVWGINLNNDLLDIYKKYLTDSEIVLVSTYKSNDGFWYYFNFDKIRKEFNLSLVAQGCNGECDLYRLELRD